MAIEDFCVRGAIKQQAQMYNDPNAVEKSVKITNIDNVNNITACLQEIKEDGNFDKAISEARKYGVEE